MAYNTELYQYTKTGLTKELVKKAIALCYRDGITSRAPLGCSGDDIALYGAWQKPNGSFGRISLITIRNYNGDPQLLITDKVGNFIYYGKYDINLGVDFIVDQYWRIIRQTMKIIDTEIPRKKIADGIKIPDNEFDTKGYAMLQHLYCGCL